MIELERLRAEISHPVLSVLVQGDAVPWLEQFRDLYRIERSAFEQLVA
jgi:hypothetical protein